MSFEILTGKKIVLIEDNEFLSTVIVKKFESAGAHITHYQNGLEGLAGVRAEKPDLVLLDIMLPVMNGYEVLEVMAKEGLTDMHPVMIVSNSGQPVEINRLLQLGARDYLIKANFTPEEVIEKASTLLAEAEAHPARDQKKILVIEDDPLLRNMLKIKLSKNHYASLMVTNGTEAVSQAKAFQPDLIILDLMIPGKDGFEILSEIKEDQAFPQIPIIVFSNKSEPNDKLRAIELGATSCHVKATTDLSSLMREIEMLTNKG